MDPVMDVCHQCHASEATLVCVDCQNQPSSSSSSAAAAARASSVLLCAACDRLLHGSVADSLLAQHRRTPLQRFVVPGRKSRPGECTSTHGTFLSFSLSFSPWFCCCVAFSGRATSVLPVRFRLQLSLGVPPKPATRSHARSAANHRSSLSRRSKSRQPPLVALFLDSKVWLGSTCFALECEPLVCFSRDPGRFWRLRRQRRWSGLRGEIPLP